MPISTRTRILSIPEPGMHRRARWFQPRVATPSSRPGSLGIPRLLAFADGNVKIPADSRQVD